jgi:mannitol/fructose-specific phosphotransferase system IIA component (Ntr-type)
MLISDVIAEGGILLGAPCDDFEQSVHGLVGALVAQGRLPASLGAAAVRAVCDREQMASTAIVEIGVSVPHARLAGIEGVVGALAASPTAVYYAMAEVPICIVALILSAPDRAADHLNVLASLSMLLHSENVRTALRRAPNAAAVLQALRTQRGAFS